MADTFAFPSTGDPQRDAEIAAQIRRHNAYESEGLCPNGCAPLELADPYTKSCPSCGFVHVSNVRWEERQV